MNKQIYSFILAICLFGIYGDQIFGWIGSNRDNIVVIVIALMIILPLCSVVVELFFELVKCTKDNFIFEVTPEKKCDGGPYMYSSDPERQKLCASFSKADLSKYECTPGLYNGRPVWRRGTFAMTDNSIGNGTLSNANWANTSCGVY